MPLTDIAVRNAKPDNSKTLRLKDERGLYLEVFPNGSKLWRLKYSFAGKEKRLALGAWPEVSLQKARHMRDELRVRIANGPAPYPATWGGASRS